LKLNLGLPLPPRKGSKVACWVHRGKGAILGPKSGKMKTPELFKLKGSLRGHPVLPLSHSQHLLPTALPKSSTEHENCIGLLQNPLALCQPPLSVSNTFQSSAPKHKFAYNIKKFHHANNLTTNSSFHYVYRDLSDQLQDIKKYLLYIKIQRI